MIEWYRELFRHANGSHGIAGLIGAFVGAMLGSLVAGLAGLTGGCSVNQITHPDRLRRCLNYLDCDPINAFHPHRSSCRGGSLRSA
jgi:hypothetical protein